MRYLPLTPDDREAMLAAIGVKSIDDLFVDVPGAARLDGPVDLPRVAGELEVERALGAMAAKNATAGTVPFFCGAGAYKHHVPATVDHLIQRSEWLTARVPDQLHPLSAGNRPGDPAVPVRVPDPGREPDRHGCGQCLAL